MKVKFFIGAIALAVLSTVAMPAFAQENGNRDENGNIVRGPYHTNRFGDNWFIGVQGGLNLLQDKDYDAILSPAVDLTIGKWFTPSTGFRFGYQGLEAAAWSDKSSAYATSLDSSKKQYKDQFNISYLHVDGLWNLSNAFSGYKETRFWDVIAYAHSGYLRSYKLNDGVNTVGVGAGMLNNFRLGNRVSITVDLRETVSKGNLHFSDSKHTGIFTALAGVKVNLGKTNWERCHGLASDKATIADLLAANAALDAANAALKNRKPETVTVERIDTVYVNPDTFIPGVVYFKRDHSEISTTEMQHIDFYVKTVMAENPDRVFTVTGSADKETGTTKRNQVLSEERANNVVDVLVKKYGIDRDKIIVRCVGDTENRFDTPELNRVVVIE